MAIWIELRCERRGGDVNRPNNLCWSDEHSETGRLADDSIEAMREAYTGIKSDALVAGWKLIRGEGWVCPCCLAFDAEKAAAGHLTGNVAE